jgi:HD-GYP domain-containing protein (c-di-GMP phosphodiesterase class II)
MDESSSQLILRAGTFLRAGAGATACFSRTLTKRAFAQGASLLCENAAEDWASSTAQSLQAGGMSSIICALLRSPRKSLGVLHLSRGPFQKPFTEDDLNMADAIAATASAGIESAQLVEKQRDLFVQAVTALAQTVELRDEYTGDHIQRVTDYALLLADELQLPYPERRHLQVGTPLHDIGKIGIEDAILRKPGKLSPREFDIMKSHTYRGAAILATIPDFTAFVPIVRNHHERWDGSGYPDGLAGDKIPLLARIVGVADAFDAMTSNRPYRPSLSVEQAFAEIHASAGAQFDPACVQALLRIRPRLEHLIHQRQAVGETMLGDALRGLNPAEQLILPVRAHRAR